MDPAHFDSLWRGQLLPSAASPFSAIQRALCTGFKPVKYSTHAQLLPFVRCTYAVRLIVETRRGEKKNNSFDARCLMLVACARASPSRIHPSRSHVRGSLGRNVGMPKPALLGKPQAPGGKKNHLATASGISNVLECQYSNTISDFAIFILRTDST